MPQTKLALKMEDVISKTLQEVNVARVNLRKAVQLMIKQHCFSVLSSSNKLVSEAFLSCESVPEVMWVFWSEKKKKKSFPPTAAG